MNLNVLIHFLYYDLDGDWNSIIIYKCCIYSIYTAARSNIYIGREMSGNIGEQLAWTLLQNTQDDVTDLSLMNQYFSYKHFLSWTKALTYVKDYTIFLNTY